LNDEDSVFVDTEKHSVSIQQIYNIAKIYDSIPVFDSICYNCGQLLFGRTAHGCKQSAVPLLSENDVQILRMFRICKQICKQI
jgi:hypothetical protein